QALVDRKKIVISEDVIREILQLDDAKGVVCLPNKEIYAGLAQMGYEKPSTKLTFYKGFFSSQWKFLIHTLLQSLSAKRTSWNEFSTTMASAVICLSKEEGIAEEQVQADAVVAATVQENVAGGRDEGESWVSGEVRWKVGRVVLRGMARKPVLDEQCMLFKRERI
nr:hypothetical protein [Tanacetum cinerariifolium]